MLRKSFKEVKIKSLDAFFNPHLNDFQISVTDY